jgi:hypothetical protein
MELELDIIYKTYCLDFMIFVGEYLQILSWYHFFRKNFVTKWLF